MKSIILIAFFCTCISSNLLSQSTFNTDSLTEEICTTIKQESLENDSLTLLNGIQKHLINYLNQIDKESWISLVKTCYFRLQRECPKFKYLLDKISPSKGDWKTVYAEPESKTSPQDCTSFFNIGSFKYIEFNGDTTILIIKDSTWTDHFIDGTYSKLFLTKLNDCDFTITFIESNNESRSNYSKPGDKYRYKIIQKFDSYFDMFVEIPGNHLMQTFRLYY